MKKAVASKDIAIDIPCKAQGSVCPLASTSWIRYRQRCSSNALASRRSAVSNPSVNQL